MVGDDVRDLGESAGGSAGDVSGTVRGNDGDSDEMGRRVVVS